MCGLGFVISENNENTDNILCNLNIAQRHRGPDDQGSYSRLTKNNHFIGFSHTRLSILDLSSAGHQPMIDEETGNIVVFNGEIYNFKELMADLKKSGETFNSNSDTEVLLKAYKHFKPHKFLQKIRGMFSFVIWDEVKQKALIARDPCGIKPLYYATNKNFFICSSEAKAIVRAGIVDGSIDYNALDSYFAFGSIQSPLTIYKGINSLLPGTMIWVDSSGKCTRPESYWKWNMSGGVANLDSLSNALHLSVKRHLIADVPVGIFLSSGIDSYALAHLCSQEKNQNLKAFTMNFPSNKSDSELIGASRIAKSLNLDHEVLNINQSILNNHFNEFIEAFDQPSDDGLNVFLISKAASNYGYKTCIHGLGGDELFGGYPSFRQVPIISKYLSMIPPFLRKNLSKVIDGDSIGQSKLAHLLGTDCGLMSTFLIRRSIFSYRQRKKLLQSDPPLGVLGIHDDWVKNFNQQSTNLVSNSSLITVMEILNYGSNKLLQDGDIMSMTNSLELRFPFLDVDLIDEVLKFSDNDKMNNKKYNKPLLLKAINNLDLSLINNKKQGFTIPVNKWKDKKIDSEIKNLSINSYLKSSGLSADFINKIIKKKLRSGKFSDWLRVWQLFIFAKWLHKNEI